MKGVCSLQFIVESDGSVYPCDFYALDEWKLGSLTETPLRRMVNSETAKRFVEGSLPVPDACRACEWNAMCRNGCRRERDPQTGLNRWCGVMKAFWTYAGERMKALAQHIARQR